MTLSVSRHSLAHVWNSFTKRGSDTRRTAKFSSIPNELELLIADKLPIWDINTLLRTSSASCDLLAVYLYRRAMIKRPESIRPPISRAVQRGWLTAASMFIELGVYVNMRVPWDIVDDMCCKHDWRNETAALYENYSS